MTRAADLEARIAEVARLRSDPPSEAGRSLVRDALAAKAGRLVARGAEVAGAWQDRMLVPDLVRACERLLRMEEGPGAKADPGCGAKTAIVDALGRIGEDTPEGRVADGVFLPGARREQWEAVWGGRTDTAGALRAACAAGLVAWHHPSALHVLADHLADPLADVRAAAARSVGRRDREDGAPLLRLRLGMGDDDPRVLGECSRALLALAPASSLPLVVRQLESADDALFAETALALGESRVPAGCDALCAAWGRTFERERRRVLLTALGAARREEAVAFLLRRVAEEARDLACDAVDVFAAYAGDPGLRARVAEAVEEAGDETIADRFEAAFGAPPASQAGGQPHPGAE